MAQQTNGLAPILTIEDVNPHLRAAEYAVRGAIAQRSSEIAAELKAGVKKPFDRVVGCNIGESRASWGERSARVWGGGRAWVAAAHVASPAGSGWRWRGTT